MNLGLIDITTTAQSLTLTIRRMVTGRPEATLSWDEVKMLEHRLAAARNDAQQKARPKPDSSDFRDGPVETVDSNAEPCSSPPCGGLPAADPFADLDLAPAEEEDPFSLL